MNAINPCLIETSPHPKSCGVETLFVPLANYTTRVEVAGAGPVLVLIPGLAGGMTLLAPLVCQLARHFRVVTYHLRGESDPFGCRRSLGLTDLVEDLAELLDKLRVERPLLMGVSFGAVIGLLCAARYPSRLAGLAVQGADVRFHRTLLRMIAGQVLAGYPLPANHAFVKQFFNLLLGGGPADRRLYDFVAEQCWQTDQGVIANRFALAEKVDLSNSLASVRTPTLIMAGERDVLVSTEGVRRMRRTIPLAKLVKLRGAGHLAFVTHPQRMALAVRRFVYDFELVQIARESPATGLITT